MAKHTKVAKLLVSTVPLVLQVEGVAEKLELKLAWTMRAVVTIEAKLREQGVRLNALQNPSQFWTELDCTKLALGIWATSQQEQPQYADEDGLDTISSFLVPENYGAAAKALKQCFVESLSKERQEEIQKAEAELQKLLDAGENPPGKPADPTPAPAQQ